MSQAIKTLKKLAAGEEYKALVQAIESEDYAGICQSYRQISELLKEARKQVLERIQNLPRQNKEEDSQRFQGAFDRRVNFLLPQWYRLDLQLREQKIMEGQVCGLGKKGDPLVKTPEGRVVVVRGTNLKEGERVTFKVVAEGEKLSFGRQFELTGDYLYLLLNREKRARIKSLFDSIGERLRDHEGKSSPAELNELLAELDNATEEVGGLRDAEKERALAMIRSYRQRLVRDSCLKLSFEFISGEEEREIREICQGNGEETARALSAPGLFRRETHDSLKAELFAGEEIRGYPEMLKSLESKLDSMNAALELIEFKSRVEKVSPLAKQYLEKMDRLFQRLSRRAQQVAFSLAEKEIHSIEDVHSTIGEAFSGANLRYELRNIFRNPEEFFALRGALTELRAIVGDRSHVAAESAVKPYLVQEITAAFGN